MKIAVIGAGVAGICAIHHIIKNIPNSKVIAYEINNRIGGTWIYTDKTGSDEFGINLTTSMYKNLRTNLPREVMQFSDFPIPDYNNVFMKNEEYLKYLNEYVNYFDLQKYVKFQHLVLNVKYEENFWSLSYKNLVTSEITNENFNFVFVCNGHYSKIYIPEYNGLHIFQGEQIHSHSYREPDVFSNKKILVVGSGASGLDISVELGNVAEKLFLSHHREKPLTSPFPSNLVQKPDVKEFTKTSVIFVDGSTEEIDVVVYCTGYEYDCPFLNENCGVIVQRNFIYPLYHHIVNARHPSMFFIGLPQLCCIVPLIDMQIRYATAAIKNDFNIPSEDEMLNHINDYYGCTSFEERNHDLAIKEAVYYSNLAKESGVQSVPPTYCLIRLDSMLRKKNLYTYRNHEYNIIDDERVSVTHKDHPESVEIIYVNSIIN